MSRTSLRHAAGVDALPPDLTFAAMALRPVLTSRRDLIDPDMTVDELDALLDAIA